MTAAFAARQSRLNEAVFKHLSDTDGVLDGLAVTGLFDDGYALADVGAVGMASSAPAFTMPTESVPADVLGKAFVRGGDTYTVVEHRPDGAGLSVLLLELAA